jgi:hypothetical protein
MKSNYPVKTKKFAYPRQWPKGWVIGEWVCPMAMVAGILTDPDEEYAEGKSDFMDLLGCHPNGARGDCDACGFRKWLWESAE